MTPREELEALRRLAELEAKARGAAVDDAPDPTATMSGPERFFAGVGQGMTDLARGAGQRLGILSQKDVDEARRLDGPLMKTGAGSIGSVVGKVSAALPTALIPGANTLAGAGAIGAVQGLLEPTSADESAIKNMAIGAAGGAGGVMLGRAVMGAAQAGKALVEPFTAKGRDQIAGRVLSRFAANPAAITAAKGGKTATGAVPTLAEETGDAGLARLQDALRSVDPQINNMIGGRLAENNAARVQALQSLASTAAKRDAAEAARKTASQPLYQQATQAAYTVDDRLADLLQRPAVRQAMERAKTLAQNKGRVTTFDVSPGNPYSGLGIPDNKSRQITGQALQDLKMAMDDMLSDPQSGFAGKAGDAVRDLRGQLVGWMEKANPAYKAARTTYADLSKPLNAMDVGDEIARRATSNTNDLAGNPRMQANALLGLLRDEETLLRRATGRRELKSLDQVMTPQDLALLRQVAGETDRAAAVASAGNGPGSATAQRMASQNVLQQLVGPTGLPTSWAESALANTVVGKPLNVIYGGVAEPRIQQVLAEAALDPAVAKRALQAAQRGDLKLPDNVITRLALQAARTGSTAVLVQPGER